MTRVVIEADGGRPESLVLVNRSESMASPAIQDQWYLRSDGLGDEWYSPADSRAEIADNPSDDGGYAPDEYLLRPKVFPIRGGLWTTASSLGQSAGRAKLARLHNRPLRVLVEDEAGPRWVYGFSRQAPVISRPSIHRLEFSLTINCPDPVKLGNEARFPAAGNVVRVENSGDVATWPTVYVSGQVTQLALQLGTQLLAWIGNAQGLTIDTRSGSAYNGSGVEIGGIQVDDAFKIPPGAHELTLVTDGQVSVGVRPGWL